MQMNFAGTVLTVDLDSYRPHFESGIEWSCVGGIWRAIDYGVVTDHYSTTLTISGSANTIHTLRDTMLDHIGTHGGFSVSCEDEEKIFGHEFQYGLGYPYSCIASEKEVPYSSVAPDGSYIATWSFTLYAIMNMLTRRKYTPTSFPTVLSSEVERTVSPHVATTVLYSQYHQVNFNTKEPSCTIKWQGTSAEIGEAKSWLIDKRTTKFQLTSPSGVFYFSQNILNQQVYFFDLTDSGNIDTSSTRAALSVTYLLA
jgi:hypothetical protein